MGLSKDIHFFILAHFSDKIKRNGDMGERQQSGQREQCGTRLHVDLVK